MAKKPPKQKTANKTAKPSGRNGNVLPLGAHEGNTGGKKGRSGRKSNAFVDECERLTDDVVLEKVGAHLSRGDPNDAAWRWCAEYVTKYTKSEPPKHVAHTGDDGGPVRFTLSIGNPLKAA